MNNPDVIENISSSWFVLKKAWDEQFTLIQISNHNDYHIS